MMNSVVDDLVQGTRVLFKTPALTLLSILALSISTGIAITTFSNINGLYLKPLPFADPEQLRVIALIGVDDPATNYPLPFGRIQELAGSDLFSGLVANYNGTLNISGDGRPQRYDATYISPGFLELLGHRTYKGTCFNDTGLDENGYPQLMISHRLWQERYRADPTIIGTQVRANGDESVIIAVLPEGFHFPGNSDVWSPLTEAIVQRQAQLSGQTASELQVVAVGRLAAGVNNAELQQRLDAYYAGWDNLQVTERERYRLSAVPFGKVQLGTRSLSYVAVSFIVVFLILLVSCANVANLLVGRALVRGREIAVRAALGATRRRIIRQLLTESFLIAGFAGVGGLLYAAWAIDVSMDHARWEMPYFMNFGLDWRVFLFAFVMVFFTAFISGILPAWQASQTDLNAMLKDCGHTVTRFRLGRMTRLLAVLQIAFSCALLFGAGLMMRNVHSLSSLEPGFAADEVLTMRMGLFVQDYPTDQDRIAFFEELAERVSALPGVQQAAVTSWLPRTGNFQEPFVVLDPESNREAQIRYTYVETVSRDYLDALQLQLLAGRGFLPSDDLSAAPVALVNDAFVRRFLPPGDPLGRFIGLPNEPGGRHVTAPMIEIVGVVPTVRMTDFSFPQGEEAILYRPSTQRAASFMTLAIRSVNEDKEAVKEAAQQVVLQMDPHLPVYFVQTIGDYIEQQILPFRLVARFFLMIGLMSLFLAGVGVYGMIAFNVNRQRREIGIRMALGCNQRHIVVHVLRQGVYQLAFGILIGTGFAALLGKLATQFTLGVRTLEPSIYFGSILILIAVAVLAFYIPARRATRLSPLEALHHE